MPTLEATPPRARARAALDDGRAADGQQRHGWLCGSQFRSEITKLRVSAENHGRVGRQAARARHRRAHLHRRADPAGRRRGGDAGGNAGRRRVRLPEKEGRGRASGSATSASDIRKGAEILPAGKRLLPQDTGLAASVGIKTLPVFRQGAPGSFLHRRRARHAGRAARAGAHLQLQPLHAARARARRSAARCATTASSPTRSRRRARCCAARRSECDLIVTSGGVSVGDADYVKPAVEAEGRCSCGASR